MKKLFTILAACLCVSSMWGVSIAVPTTTLDLKTPSSDLTTASKWKDAVSYSLNDDYLVISAYAAYQSAASDKQTWIKQSSTGSNASTWSATSPFKGSTYYTTASYATLQSGRYIAFKVTNTTSFAAFVYNTATNKRTKVQIFDVTSSCPATIDNTSVTPTYTLDNTTSSSEETVLSQNLDKTKTYVIVVTGTNTSNSRCFEVAFGRPSNSNVDKPTFTPAAGTLASVPQNITLSVPTGCTVYYTTNGTNPTSSSTQYTGAFQITGTTTVKAIAVNSSDEVSDIATADYTYTFAGPDASEDDLTYTDPFSVTLTKAGCTIYYTTDGSTPTTSSTLYSSAVVISGATTVLKAIAVDTYGNVSNVTTKTYSYDPPVDWNTPFTLTFVESGNGTDASTAYSTVEGTFTTADKYVSAISANKAYPARTGRGAKFGGSGNTGSIIITLKKSIKIGKIVVNAAGYSSSDKGKVTIAEGEYATTREAASGFDNYTHTFVAPLTATNSITIGGAAVDASNYRVYIKSLTIYPADDITITTAGYATYFNSAKAYYMPDGLEGITVTRVAGDALTLTTSYAAGAVVPAGEALILHGAEGPYTLYAGETSNSVVEENKLKGTSTADEWTTGGEKYYRLSQHEGQVGFYYGAADGAAFKPGANKAYLAIPAGTSAPERFIFGQQDVPTELQNASAEAVSRKVMIDGRLYILRDGNLFDLNGRLVK